MNIWKLQQYEHLDDMPIISSELFEILKKAAINNTIPHEDITHNDFNLTTFDGALPFDSLMYFHDGAIYFDPKPNISAYFRIYTNDQMKNNSGKTFYGYEGRIYDHKFEGISYNIYIAIAKCLKYIYRKHPELTCSWEMLHVTE